MANKSIFQSKRGRFLPKANAMNRAGGRAYRRDDKQTLAQYAATGCLNGTFYCSADEQLEDVLALAERVAPEFVAQVALYARGRAYMKDMPALLCAHLSVSSRGLLAEIFDRVIDSPKMLRNFVQIMRSGVVGRRSLGTLPKQLVRQWLESRTDEQIFIGSIGNDPSLTDIIKMAHPKPQTASREALYGYLIGRSYDAEALPSLVRQYEKFKRNTNAGKIDPPDVPFQMLASLPLSKRDWRTIARHASWQMTRMNLTTFYRHGVFDDYESTQIVADRLRNPRLIEKAKVFPYQLLNAHAHAQHDVPKAVRRALAHAMEIAIKNVPRVEGKVYVFPDVSGSMHSPVTGHRPGATTTVKCIDVAALVAAAILRKNRHASVIPFESNIVNVRLDPQSSVLRNAQKLASLPAGGTNCSAPLRHLNDVNARGDLIVYVSDNESWVDSPNYGWVGGSATETMREWAAFKVRCPQARMVCIDIQPNPTTQVVEREDIVNVGGFSDRVFDLLANVARGRGANDYWVTEIEKMRI